MENYWFGVLFNIFGSIFVNFGTNIMKYAHSLSSSSSSASSSNSHATNISDSSINSTTDNPQPLLAVQKSPRPSHSPASSSSFILHSSTRTNTPLTFAGLSMTWTRGCFLFAIGSALTFFSFAFASQSLLSSLGTLQFISNVFFSRFVLGEKLSLRVVIATGLIGAGIVITVAFSNHSSKVYTVQDLLRLYDANYFFFLQMIGLAICLQAGVYILYTRRERRQLPLPLSGIVRPVVFASMAATIGTQSVLQSKCLAEIIKSSSLGDAQQQIWFIGIILLVFVTGLSIWLISLNEALKEFDGAVIIPLLQVCWTISAIIQGGVYFREFVLFTSAQYGGFLFGLVVVVFGVAVLTYRRDSHGSVAFDEEDGKGTGASYKTSDDSLLLSEEEYEANLDEEEELERLGSDTSHLLP